MITMNTNGKEEKNKVITYNPSTQEIVEELKLEDDYGFQLVKFKNNIFGINYINPTKGIQETVMVSTDAGINIGPISFLRFAEEAHKIQTIGDFKNVDKIELVIAVDPENKEIYHETINSDQAETLIEKLEISRELVELKHENNFWTQHGTTIIMLCVLANVALAAYNFYRLFNGV